MRVGGESKILARLRHRHIGHAPAEARWAADIRPPHDVFRFRRPACVLLHRKLTLFRRAQVEIGHAGDDHIVIGFDADGRIAGQTIRIELHEQLAVGKTLLQHACERVGESHIAIRLRHALELHTAEDPLHLLAIRMIPGEAVRAGAVTAGVAVVGRDIDDTQQRIGADFDRNILQPLLPYLGVRRAKFRVALARLHRRATAIRCGGEVLGMRRAILRPPIPKTMPASHVHGVELHPLKPRPKSRLALLIVAQ